MTNGRLRWYALRACKIAGILVPALFLMGPTGRTGFDNPCEPNETNCVVLSKIDFAPQDGSWNLNWPSPRHSLVFAEAKRFRVILELDRNAPETFSRDFLIKEDRWFGWETRGQFTATFNAGSRTPVISYPSVCCGADTIPSGTPATLSDGTFWMGCTRLGKVKANGPHGDDGNARLRLEKVNKSDDIGVQHKFSPAHEVNCVSPSGSSGSQCPSGTTRKCPGENRCYSPAQSCP